MTRHFHIKNTIYYIHDIHDIHDIHEPPMEKV